MNSENKVWVLTIALWAVTLVVYPFFYSRATGAEILTQGDLVLALVTSLIIGVGLRLNSKLFTTLNYIWGTMTLTWILIANTSRLISKTEMEILDAIYARVFFNINEWWIVTLLVLSGLIIIYYLLRNLKTDSLISDDMGQGKRRIVTWISIAIPILWCVTLNLKSLR